MRKLCCHFPPGPVWDVRHGSSRALRCITVCEYNDTVNEIAHNLGRVREQIQSAAARSGRDAGDVALIAVSKTIEP